MKTRFKMYKNGKLWCYAAIAFAAVTMGSTTLAHADSDTASPITASMMSQRPTEQSRQTTSPVASTNEVPVDQTTTNNDVNANQGSLDHVQVTTDTKTGTTTLNATGWQVAGQSNQERYRYAILYDNTMNREVDRQRVTPVDRTDVQQAYPHVENSLHAGFNVNFTLPSNFAGHSLSVIARYSTDALNGEGQHTDYWFAPVVIDNQNRASLDSITNDGQGNVVVSGWHASNVASGMKYHYIIAYDSTTGREVTRQLVKAGQTRADVSRAFPMIGNASNSGFKVQFKLTSQYARDNIQFVSRWTNDPAGNGQAVDYWFNISRQNRGHLDQWDLSDGSLRVSGWHADDAAIFEPYHYLIVFDNTTGRQVAAIESPTSASKDVARVYQDTYSAVQSRFSADFKTLNLTPNHSYSLVSRYSTSAKGNGNDGVHTDYWYAAQQLNQHAFNVDHWTAKGNQLTVSGWMINDASLTDQLPFVILVADGHEIGRQRVTLTFRPDVAKVYPGIYDSQVSGFTATFTIPNNVQNNLNLVFRFSNASNGEGQHADMWSPAYAANVGSIDSVNTNGNRLNVSGWHAAEGALNKQYSYLFAMDALTGQEIARWQISDNLSRGDVQKAYPWLWDSGQSGFQVSVGIPDSLTNREVRFMHRYTNDATGNGNSADYWSNDIYYFNPDNYAMAVNQFVTILDPANSRNSLYTVYFGNDGRMVRGSRNINGHWYNIDGNNGKVYSFTQRVIDWFRNRRHHLTYSMYGSRNGRDGTADCSGSMTQALRDAGAYPYGALYNTTTMHPYVAGNGYYLAGQGRGRMQVQYGDIVIWGVRGYSTGGAGHTVIVSTYGNGDRINCISTCGYNHHQPGEAVQEFNYYSYWASDGYPYQYIYRPYDLSRA
ncbi:peptidoglycan amidohydrolase family protein [Limosilactobacillus caecicola]|uniref:peptidoglycan amidohydrolase family protein n=1 Tax=Limosilactobacillus caecicola TaxID=2941332 RepID=UPI00203EC182|nr:peptidoglycan amidohydrolase family protein [Limosilactobacillus caecicola]